MNNLLYTACFILLTILSSCDNLQKNKTPSEPVIEVGEYDEINENDNKNDDPSTVSLKSVKVEENNDNQETTKQNDDQKMPNETAQYLNDKIRKKRGVHLALIRVSNVFLLVVLPFFMVQCKLT